jgi:adenine-specific DNA-methyltransferase
VSTYALNQITTGNARKLAPSIADGSVDLVLADPVYQNISDYRWLAKTALRVLKTRGVCLAWASVPKLGRAQAAMERAGLEYVYTLFYTVIAKTYRMRWYNLFCWTTPCLWFQRPGEATKPNKWMPDTYSETIVVPPDLLDNTTISTANAHGPFEWNKNTGVLVKYIEQYSRPGELVYDPFTGTGSVPVACRMTGRSFIASELLPARAEEARQRLGATPISLFSPDALINLPLEAA